MHHCLAESKKEKSREREWEKETGRGMGAKTEKSNHNKFNVFMRAESS